MRYHDDLIEHAIFLAQRNTPSDPSLPEAPKQVDLRRAVSAAYYAVFHLLTTEAAQNWKHPSRRTLPSDPADNHTVANLKVVAGRFATLQEARQTAD